MRGPLVALFLLALAFTADAQEASNRTYLKLMEVQELWDEQRYPEALAELREYGAKVDDPGDNAIVQQYIAHTYVFMDQIANARTALETALATPNLSTALLAELNLIYGQVILTDEMYEEASKALEYWFANTEKDRQAGHIFSTAYANFMIEDYARAEELVELAINEERKPPASWHRIHYHSLFYQKKYKQAEQVILGLLNSDPYNDDYWRIYANHHLQIENGRQALTGIAIAYNAGLIDEATDLKRMIALYGMVEVPEKAARLLEMHLGNESIETDADMLKRLGDLWLLARNRAKAKEVLLRAAEIAPDGKTYEVLGNIYFEDEDWMPAYNAYMEAVDQGGLDDVERIILLAGISAERGGDEKLARDAYNEARESDKHRNQAEALLRRLDQG